MDSRFAVLALSLNRLSRPETIDEADCCAAVLQRVAIPDDCSLSVEHCDYYMASDQSTIVAATAAIDRHHKAGKRRKRSGLLVGVSPILDLFRLCFRETYFEPSLAATTAPIQSEGNGMCSIGLSMSIDDALKIQSRAMFDALLRDDIHRLEVAGKRNLSESIIESVAAPLPRVDTVHTTGFAALGLLKALHLSKAAEGHRGGGAAGGSSPENACPGLEPGLARNRTNRTRRIGRQRTDALGNPVGEAQWDPRGRVAVMLPYPSGCICLTGRGGCGGRRRADKVGLCSCAVACLFLTMPRRPSRLLE